jgi:hypothetical protein
VLTTRALPPPGSLTVDTREDSCAFRAQTRAITSRTCAHSNFNNAPSFGGP